MSALQLKQVRVDEIVGKTVVKQLESDSQLWLVFSDGTFLAVEVDEDSVAVVDVRILESANGLLWPVNWDRIDYCGPLMQLGIVSEQVMEASKKALKDRKDGALKEIQRKEYERLKTMFEVENKK